MVVRWMLGVWLAAGAAVADNSVCNSVSGGGAGVRPAEIVPPLDGESLGHDSVCCRACGWSKDGADLGYCAEGGYPGTWCEALVGGQHVEASIETKKDRALLQRLLGRGFQRGTAGAWAYGDDLVITWRTADQMELWVGAKLRGSDDAAWPLHLTDEQGFRSHPDVIAFSADGRTLGVIAHWYQGEWSNGYRVGTVEAKTLAEQAYNAAGMKQLRRGNLPQAAALFEKAASADPASEKAAYNRACALARLGAPEAKAALERAIAIGGAAVKKKAARDSDFAQVRAQAWFTELTK
jgi:hypothetical protein